MWESTRGQILFQATVFSQSKAIESTNNSHKNKSLESAYGLIFERRDIGGEKWACFGHETPVSV